jgi:hypothetical protein
MVGDSATAIPSRSCFSCFFFSKDGKENEVLLKGEQTDFMISMISSDFRDFK